MDRFLERLTQLVPPPSRQGSLPDWAAVERSMGFRLPSDYRELAYAYGPGKFDDFLALFHPQHPIQRLDIVHGGREGEAVLREYEASGETLPAPVDRLWTIATTDNGDSLYWIREPVESPDHWGIAVNGARDFDDWQLFDRCLTDFLVSVLSGDLTVSAFPEDFPYPDKAPVFVPYANGSVGPSDG
jgi:hypothetical protein